jgi:signal transduction histidine kinase/CheY-like chemotaxis protein
MLDFTKVKWNNKNILLFFIIPLLFGCSESISPNPNKKYFVGFSQCARDDVWHQAINYEMMLEVALHPNLELLTLLAQDDTQKQIADIEYLINQKIDLLIVSPNEAESITPIVEKAFKNGIPIILLDRKINSELYTAYVGADNYQIGFQAGQYVINILKNSGKIFEIRGLAGSTPAIERHRGFADAISKNENIEIIDGGDGEWQTENSEILMVKGIKKHPDIDVIFAHNDWMAFGAYNVLNKLKMAHDIKFIGIDALPGDSAGLQMVMDDILDASFLYPTGGDVAVQTALKILNGQAVNKNIKLESVRVDSTNARMLKLQTDHVREIQSKIESQNKVLDEQITKYELQQTILFTLIIGILLLATSLFFLFRAFRMNKMINIELEEKNLAISEQSAKLEMQHVELEKLHQTVKKTNESKIQFFTNISHEFRTPLTLILGTLDQLKESKINEKTSTKQFNIVNRNAQRLLRLVNQLMDFRKIDAQKMTLKVFEHDVVDFLREIVKTFEDLSDRKNIKLNFFTQHNQINLHFDEEKISKVAYNLLSNAFKFTPNFGEISLSIMYGKCIKCNQKCVDISVKDTGIGIPEAEIEHIFEPFYEIEHKENKRNTGTGIGLALCQKLVELHHGTLHAKSEVDKGSVFIIQLHLETNRYSQNEIKGGLKNIDSFEHLVPMQIEKVRAQVVNPLENYDDNVESILIVEDNKEVINMIKDNLDKDYRILEAYNGKDGLCLAKLYTPDIIISDIMMPIMDGNEMTKLLKSDIATSHIPIILLSAKSTDDNQIEGFSGGADHYITKPFNLKILVLRLKNILSSSNKCNSYL